MTNVGNIDNCYKYICKNLLFFIFLLLMVSDLGLIQVAHASSSKFLDAPVDKDITSAFGYDYGNDDTVECYYYDQSKKKFENIDINNYKYVPCKEGKCDELLYEKNGFTSKFFKCIDAGFAVTGNFNGEDYAPCNEGFDYAKYKNKLNYVSFNKDAKYHLYVIANNGNVCDLRKVPSDKNVKHFDNSSNKITGGCTIENVCINNNGEDSSCLVYENRCKDNTEIKETGNNRYYQKGDDCYEYFDNALPKYVVAGGDKPTDGTEYNEFYVFKKAKSEKDSEHKILSIEKNRSTFPGQVYNCHTNNNKNFYLPPCGKNVYSGKALYKESNASYDEYLQLLNNSNTTSGSTCLVIGSDISYCSDLKEDDTLKYPNGLEYINSRPNCFLKSCVDVTEKEWEKINNATEAKGKFCSEYRYLVNSDGLKYFPKNDLIKEKKGISVGNNSKNDNERNAVYCSDLKDGNLAFPSGQNKNKDNCYLKRCIALNAEERRKIILANLNNFDKKIARIDYEHNVIKGDKIKCPKKCPDSHPIEVKIDGEKKCKKEDDKDNKDIKEQVYSSDNCSSNMDGKFQKLPQPILQKGNSRYGETIKYTYHYSSNSTHFENMEQGNIKNNLSKYCEDEVFFVNGTLDEFDDALLNVVSCSECQFNNVKSTPFTKLFINQDSEYSLNNSTYNSNTQKVFCRTPIVPVYKSDFRTNKYKNYSFVCNVVITKNENSSSAFTDDGNSDIFPDCSVRGSDGTNFGTYDEISIKDIDIGGEYNNILGNIDNTLLFLNAEILDLDVTDDYKCKAMSFNKGVDVSVCKITEDNGYAFDEDDMKGGGSDLPSCSMVKYDSSGDVECEEKDKVYELDLLKTYNIPKFSTNSSSIINLTENKEKTIEKFLVDNKNYNSAGYLNYQSGGTINSFFDCGLYALIDFDDYNKTDNKNICDTSYHEEHTEKKCAENRKYNVHYNNFSSNREFSVLVERIRKKCKSKHLPLAVPDTVLSYDTNNTDSLFNKKYGQKPLNYNSYGLANNITESCNSSVGVKGEKGAAFGCYFANKGSNTHFCKIPWDESFYIAEYRTLNGYSNNGCTIGKENTEKNGCVSGGFIKPEKPGYVRLQVAACIRHPDSVFINNDQKCGERDGSDIKSRCIILDSNYIEYDEESKKGKLSLIKDYITNKELDGDSRGILYNLSVDGTSELAGMYDLTARRSNSNFFRTDRYGRDVYVFYDFATNYMCTTANETDHRDYYASAVITAECFGIGLVGGYIAGFIATSIASAFIITAPSAPAIGSGVAVVSGLAGFGICEGIRVGGGEADFTFSNDLFKMKDYFDNDADNGFYSNLNITNNNNILYNYYRRSDNLKEDLKYKLEGSKKNYAGEYGDGNVLSKKIIDKCGLKDFVVRERVCWDGSPFTNDDDCQYADWSMNRGSGENYQYLIRNYNADFSDKNLNCKYKCFNKERGLGSNDDSCAEGYTKMCVISIKEDNAEPMLSCFNKPENCLTEEQKKCLKEYGVHFFTNAQKLMDKTDYDDSIVDEGKNYGGINYLDFLKGYGDGYFTRAGYDTLNYKNGIVAINMVEAAQNTVSEKQDCILDKYGSPIGDLQKCRGYSYCKEYSADGKTCVNNSEVFVKENQSVRIGLQTSPQLFFTIANPQNTYDLFKPFLELIEYYPHGVTPKDDYSNALKYEEGDIFKLDLFNPTLLFRYDFPNEDNNFKNKYTKRCIGKGDVIGQDCSEIWAEIPFDKNVSPVYNLQYKSEKSGNSVDNFYFILSKEFNIDGNGVEIPTVCLHQLERISGDIKDDLGVFITANDGTQYSMKERNVLCYERKYPTIRNIAMKPAEGFNYQNSYINAISINGGDNSDILSKFSNNVYYYGRISDENDDKFNIKKDAQNSIQNLVFTFRRNECTRLENDYYMNQYKINHGDFKDRNELLSLQDDNKHIKNIIKPDCDLQNGNPYYVVSGDKKYKLKRNYGAYGGFNEVCLSDAYVNRIKDELDINYDVIAYQNENSVDGKCFLDRLSRIKSECLVSKKVSVICADIYGDDNCKNKNKDVISEDVISVVDSITGDSIDIVEIDCEAFLINVILNSDNESNYIKNNTSLYIKKMKACYKGGYNSAGNIYSDKNRYVMGEDGEIKLDREFKLDYSCSCMKGNSGNSDYTNLRDLMGDKFFKNFAYRTPTAREISLCVDLVENPKCEAIEYRTVGGNYIDSNLYVPESEYTNITVLGDKQVDCYPNMSCSKEASKKVDTQYNAGFNQHFWRTNEKLFGVLSSSVYGNLGHAEFESTLYCEDDLKLCVGKDNSKITGSCNGYWTTNNSNSAPIAVCKRVNCKDFAQEGSEEKSDEQIACEKRYGSVDESTGYALDENGDYVYEYKLIEDSPNCTRYKCPGMFSDLTTLISIKNDGTNEVIYNVVRNIVDDEIEFSTNAGIVTGSVLDEENNIYEQAKKQETDFRDVKHFIDYGYSDIEIDQRGRNHGFAVWVNTDKDGKIINDTESSDIVKLVTATQCLTGFGPAGTNYRREILLDNIYINNYNNYKDNIETLDEQDLYCGNNCESNQINYMEIIKKQIDYINDIATGNSANSDFKDYIIDTNRLPQRYCGQKGNWLDTRDIYSNKPVNTEKILFYSREKDCAINKSCGNPSWTSTLQNSGYFGYYNPNNTETGNFSSKQLFEITSDGVFNKIIGEDGEKTENYQAGYITKDDTNRYCERLFCPEVNIDRYYLGDSISQIEYDIYGIEKQNIDSTDIKFDNKIYSYTDRVVNGANNKMNRYTTWRHTAGATWENIVAPRNDSSKLCIDGNCSDSRNISKILENRNITEEQEKLEKDINKFLRKVRGVCQTEYGYYERNSKFIDKRDNIDNDENRFLSQLGYIELTLKHKDDDYKKDILGENISISVKPSYDVNGKFNIGEGPDNVREIYTIGEENILHSIDSRKFSMQQEEGDDERISISGVSKKPAEGYAGIEPTRTCNSAGIWSGVSDGCFRACEMLDLYNVKVSPEVSGRRFDSYYRYDPINDIEKQNQGNPLYVRNSDIKAIQFFEKDNDREKNYRNIFNIVQNIRYTNNLDNIEKTKLNGSYGDYLTGGAMWPRTVVNLNDSTLKGGNFADPACGKIECVNITEPHEGYDGASTTKPRQHCETVRCDSKGRRLRYIEVTGWCDNRFNTISLDDNDNEYAKLNDEARNYFQNKTKYADGSRYITPMRRCYEDGVWGPVYGPTRCVLQKSCKPLYFNPKNLYYLIYMYNYLYSQDDTFEYKIKGENKSLIDYFEEYIKNRSTNIDLIKGLINRTQSLLSNILSNQLIFNKYDNSLIRDTIYTKNGDYTSRELAIYTIGQLMDNQIIDGDNRSARFTPVDNTTYEGVSSSYQNNGYDLYCNVGVGDSWLVADHIDKNLNEVCNQNSMENSYDCAKNADLGEMIKPKVCDNSHYKNMKNNNTVEGIANRLKHKVLRNSSDSNCQGVNLSNECTTTNRLNIGGKKIETTSVEMYVKTSYFQKVYEELKTDGKGDTYEKEYYKDADNNNLSNTLENESMKNITLGTHEYLSFQGHTKCDEDYFYNSELNKTYNIEDYQVVYECRMNGQQPEIGFPSEDSDFGYGGKIISPADCAPKYCGDRKDNKIVAHRNWSISNVGEVRFNTSKYGYKDTDQLPNGNSQVSSLKCDPGYAFVIKDIDNVPVAVGEEGDTKNGIYNKKIGFKEGQLEEYNKYNIIDYYYDEKFTKNDNVDADAIDIQAKKGGWVESINLGCYANNYDTTNSISHNGISIPLDRTFGRLGADGIDYDTEITFCRDIAQQDCDENLTLADTFTDGFLDDSYNHLDTGYTKKGYCVYMGCRFNDINFIYLDEKENGQQKHGTINNPGYDKKKQKGFTDIISGNPNPFEDNCIDDKDCKKGLQYGFGQIFSIGGQSYNNDKCNYKIGDTNGTCNVFGMNLCPEGYDQYTKGIEEPISYKDYIFSGKSHTVDGVGEVDSSNEKYNVCRTYVQNATLQNKETTANGGNPNGSTEEQARYYNNWNVDSVSYNDDYNKFIAKYSGLSIDSSYTLNNDDIRDLDKKIVAHWNKHDQEAFKNETVWNACVSIKGSTTFSTNTYKCAFKKEEYYNGYYKYALHREECGESDNTGDDVNYAVLLGECNSNNCVYGGIAKNDFLSEDGVGKVFGYFFGRELDYQSYNIDDCYNDYNGTYGFRYKFDNLNSVDKQYDFDKKDIAQWTTEYVNDEKQSIINHYFCTYKNCFGNEVINDTTGQCANSITLCNGTTFDTIKNKYNTITTDCLFATNSGTNCSYDKDRETYRKLVIMKEFLNSETEITNNQGKKEKVNNLYLYKTLINDYIEEEFEDLVGDDYDDILADVGVYTTMQSLVGGFQEGEALNVCQNVIAADGSANTLICLITYIKDLTQYFTLSQQGSNANLKIGIEEAKSRGADIGKLQEYTKKIYNDFFDHAVNSYKLETNKQGIINLKNAIDTNCGIGSNPASAFEVYYNDVKRSNFKFEKQGIQVNSGFYTLFRCDLKTGKIKTIGWDNEEMVCAKRCEGATTGEARIDPTGRGDFFYKLEDFRNLRHTEIFEEQIYANARCVDEADVQRFSLSCNNGTSYFSHSGSWDHNSVKNFTFTHGKTADADYRCLEGGKAYYYYNNGNLWETPPTYDNTDYQCEEINFIEGDLNNKSKNPLFKYKMCIRANGST